jgi:hypothetical protein
MLTKIVLEQDISKLPAIGHFTLALTNKERQHSGTPKVFKVELKSNYL